MKKAVWMNVFPLLFVLLLLPVKLLAESFYEGKTVTLICSSQPGGGTDRYSRLLARHLPKYIPGNPKIIVQNLPGAGSMIAASNIYNFEKPSGLVFGILNQALPLAQLLNAPGIQFDILKYEWIGSIAREVVLFTVRSDLPYRSVSDLRQAKEPIPLGTSGPATMTHQFPALLEAFAGLNFKMVVYPSATASTLAVERKEVDATASTLSGLKSYIDRGLLRPLIRGPISVPRYENLPMDEDLATDKRGKTLMALRSATDKIARPFVAPPKTPPERMKILRDAFAKVSKDPEFLKEAHKFGLTPEYVTVEETREILKFIFSQPDDIVRDLGKFIKF